MANCQCASGNLDRPEKRKRQPEVTPRRSARLKPVTESATITRSHLTHVQRPADALTNFVAPETDLRRHEDPSLRGPRQPKKYHNLQSCKRRRLTYESSPQSPSLENFDPIDHWRRSGFFWPKKCWSKSAMEHYLPRKKSATILRRKRSGSGLGAQSTGTPSTNTPSDQKSREEKSAPYRDPRYETILATKDSFMYKDSTGISGTSKTFCRTLLGTTQSVPSDTLFRDDLFDEICEAIRNRSESRVIWDISQLLVPSAESLAIRGERELRVLIQSINEGWSNSIPFTKTRPQPDHAVGFRREAFTSDQLKKLEPFVGDIYTELSLFMGTYYLYFPFLTCEVKCGAAALDIADRQNAHSMTLAVRGVVDLFRLVGREKELNREILAFSISHDHRSVRIYGHYAVIEDKKTSYYRHPIHEFSFTALDGQEKWTAYKFTKNVYKVWMPPHLRRLCSAIDAIPADLGFEVSQSELRFSEHSSLSQHIAGHHLSDSNTDHTTTGDHSSRLESIAALKETPDTSFVQSSEQNRSEKHKKKP